MNVEITGLTRRFGRTMAVAGVDLRAGPGVFGRLGPNGAGKTSLLRMMATAIRPTSGTLRLRGRDPGSYGPRREIRRRLGYLPQNLGYYPGFTVAESVEYFALLKEVPAAQIPAAVAMAIERVELGGKRRRSCAPCPGGCCAGQGSRRRSSTSPGCCCWTSQRPVWTPSNGWRSAPCCASWASAPPSWSAHTWSRTSAPPARRSR
jgi:ABC-type transport system involved in cytochrome c biogenesis ATPase subunit